MQRATPFLVFATLLTGCVAGNPEASKAPQDLAEPARMTFSAASVVDADISGSEPVVAVDPGGRVFVSAMPGNDPLGAPFVSHAWVSDDGRAPWRRLDPNPAAAGGVGAGGGDTALAIGRDGSVFVADLWVGSNTVSSSHDHGATWSRSLVTGAVPWYDRPWAAVDRQGRAYVIARTLAPGLAEWVTRSDDGGLSWATVGRVWTSPLLTSSPTNGNLVVNPATGALLTIHGCEDEGLCVSESRDGGVEWHASRIPSAPSNVEIIPTIAMDDVGDAFAAWKANGSLWLAWSADAAHWSSPVPVPSGAATAVLPWIEAGGDGRVAIAFYGTDVRGDPNDVTSMREARWRVHVASARDARVPNPTWDVVAATDTPVHEGSVNTRGVTLAVPGRAPDWSLGDFLQLCKDREGRVVVAFTTGTAGKAPERVMVAVQSEGLRLA